MSCCAAELAVVGWFVIFGFDVGQQRDYYTQRLNFFLQPQHFKLFLPQNFVNILHGVSTSKI